MWIDAAELAQIQQTVEFLNDLRDRSIDGNCNLFDFEVKVVDSGGNVAGAVTIPEDQDWYAFVPEGTED